MAVDGPVPGDIRQGDHWIDLREKSDEAKENVLKYGSLAGRFAVLGVCKWIGCVLRVCCILQSSVL